MHSEHPIESLRGALRALGEPGRHAPLALALLACACQPAPRRPNVLLVTIDTLRADRLGCYGYSAAETPGIDRLAGQGVLFLNAYSPLPLTLPAHATLLTGLEPPGHGLVDNGQSQPELGAPTLAERLQAQGYETGAFVAAFVLNRAFGLARGFAHYDDGPPEEAELEGLFRRTAPARERVDALLAWLGQPRDGPFFAWLHLYDVHGPHVAPDPFALRYATRPYDGEVAYVDAQLVRVWDFLRARGLEQRTLVVLVSDHGEGLGEHGEQAHGIFLYDATLRVPLVWRWPGVLPAGRVERQAATLADVAPSVLALLRLPLEPALHGRALFSGSSAPRLLWAQSDYPRRQYGWSELRAVRRGRYKYVRAPRPELYDLEADPRELHDQSARQPALARELDLLVDSTERRLRRPQAAAHEPGEEQRARLAALGYVGGVALAEKGGGHVDPKDGLPSLSGLERAFDALEAGPEGWQRAEQELRRLLERYPSDGHLALGHGRALELLERLDEAAGAYRLAAQAETSRLLALARLVELARRRGDVAEELDSATRMASAFPALASAQRRLGEALAHAGRASEARAALGRALQLDPRSRAARLEFGRLLLAHGTLAEARAFAERLQRELPGDGEVAALSAAVAARAR